MTSLPSQLEQDRLLELERAFVGKVYGWMCAALAITGLVAVATAATPAIRNAVYGQPGVFIGLIIGELILVMVLSWAMPRISAGTATVLFVIYSAVNGLTLSFIFLVYQLGSIYSTFFVTAGLFGVMAAYGHFTKRDLTSIGSLCIMGLIGIILGSVVNAIFFRNEMFYWIVTYVGIAVFIGLTAYDAQKIKQISWSMSDAGEAAVRKGAIYGALALYLDFVNLFLLLLRVLGRRR